MKKIFLFVVLLTVFAYFNCDDDSGNSYNINIESITYELAYNNYSVVKVIIKTYDSLENDVSFKAYLFAEGSDKEYLLNCYSTFYDIIECFSRKNETFDTNDKYYLLLIYQLILHNDNYHSYYLYFGNYYYLILNLYNLNLLVVDIVNLGYYYYINLYYLDYYSNYLYSNLNQLN